MFTIPDDFENTPAFFAMFVVVFPLLFFAIWSFVLWITSWMSGWRHMAVRYPHTDQQVINWMHRGGGSVYRTDLPFAGARGRLAVGANREGMVIKPAFLFRPFHPQLFLPYDQIVAEEPKRLLIFDFVMLTMKDMPKVRIGILRSAKNMAEKLRAG